MKRLSWLVACAFGAVLWAACTSHGEGGRCDPGNVPAGSNQNADCNDGLACISGTELTLPDGGGHLTGVYVCCPPTVQERAALPDDDICKSSASSPGSDASIPEGGINDVNVSDVVVDQSTSDVTTDAPADATSADAGDDAADAASE
jgi:hypothetical protein